VHFIDNARERGATCWTSRSPRSVELCPATDLHLALRCPTLSVGPIWIRQISIQQVRQAEDHARTGLNKSALTAESRRPADAAAAPSSAFLTWAPVRS